MCYRPISIANPKLCKNHVYDRALIEVPCGKCHECKEEKRLSWFVRLYYEWQYCVNCGGFSLYETLTYDEQHIPKMFDSFEFPELKKYGATDAKGIRCFSKRDIQLYLKKIRKRLSRVYPNIDLKGKIKYFCSMEFGSHTHRPHYHIIFFVSSPFIRPYDFKYIVEELWHPNGFTCAGKLTDGFITEVGALSYCSKYVCKDLSDETWFRILENRLKKMGLKKEDYDCCFPHHLQSSGLGIYALQCDELNDLDNFFNGNIILPDKKLVVRSYKLPLYYERKMFYDVKYRYYNECSNSYEIVDCLSDVPRDFTYTPIYVLNELGLEMKDKRFQKAIDAVTNVYRVCMSLPENSNYINKLNKKYETFFTSLTDFQCTIKANLQEESFVFYSLVYRGCVSCGSAYVPSIDNHDARKDYNLIQLMESGRTPLSCDYNDFLYNIDCINKIPLIEDYYQMLRFLFKLVHLETEKIFMQRDMDYCNQKTIYLRNKEKVV